MRNYHLFKKNYSELDNSVEKKKIKSNKASLAMFSDFFSNANENGFSTNAMYANFKDQIVATIDVYSPKVDITLDVYELKPSSQIGRDFVLLGFKKYIQNCYRRVFKEFLNILITTSIFFVVGITLIIASFALLPLLNNLQWPFYLVQTMGTVLVWQFVGFWAFEFSSHYKTLNRLKQIENIEFVFKKWE